MTTIILIAALFSAIIAFCSYCIIGDLKVQKQLLEWKSKDWRYDG